MLGWNGFVRFGYLGFGCSDAGCSDFGCLYSGCLDFGCLNCGFVYDADLKDLLETWNYGFVDSASSENFVVGFENCFDGFENCSGTRRD